MLPLPAARASSTRLPCQPEPCGEGRLQARLDTFERPYPGYEYELGRGGQEAYGGHEFMVICRSNGTAWPPLVPQGMYGCWYSDKEHEVARGAIQLRDPNEKRGSVHIGGYKISHMHDFTCGFLAQRIWWSIEATGALARLAVENRELIASMLRYYLARDERGSPCGTSRSGAYLSDHCCTLGRHRAPSMADWQGAWLHRTLGLTVFVNHVGLFKDASGPCGCGQRSCSIAEKEHRFRTDIDRVEFYEASDRHRSLVRDLYCEYMDVELTRSRSSRRG